MKYVSVPESENQKGDVLAVSTEDGRVIFYSTTELKDAEEGDESEIPYATPLAQVGGKQVELPGRIKDFEILSLAEQAKEIRNDFLVVTGNSDGVVRIWKIAGKDLVPAKQSKDKDTIRQVGNLLTTYETGNRITCLASFVMLPAEDPSTLFDSEGEDEDEDEDEDEEEEESSSDEDE
jgi:protein MAK11